MKPVDKAKLLCECGSYREAEEILAPISTITARALRALCLCYLQREDDAAAIVHELPNDPVANRVNSILACHYASREAMVRRVKAEDPAGIKWANHFRNHPDFKAAIRLTATLIVKNEAQRLATCLKSISPLVDEIVIVDTGSTDDTVAIAKSFIGKGPTVILGQFDWIGDFAAARNHALSLATGDWILLIDADEQLTEGSFGEVRQALIRPQFGGFHIRIINFMDDLNDELTYMHSPVRLFRRLPEVVFVGRIHEQVVDALIKLGLPLASLSEASFLHEGYRPTTVHEKNKDEIYIEMLEREVRENPNDPFQWFNLANAYTVAAKFAEVEFSARQACQRSDPSMPFFELAYQLLANALIQQGKYVEAIQTTEKARELGACGMFCEFETANALLLMDRPDLALEAIDRSLAFDWTANQTGDYTVFSFKRNVVRGQVLLALQRLDEALIELDYALSVTPDYPNSRFLKANVLELKGVNPEAISLYESVLEIPHLTIHALSGLARIALAEARFNDAIGYFEKAWKMSPADYDAWAKWAEACEAAGDLEAVVRAYEAFAQAQEPSADILINWGRALDRAGQSQRALECYTEALRRSPDEPNGYFNCGDLLYRSGLFEDASLLYQGGLRLKPDFAQGWFVFGNTLAQLGASEAAVRAYDEALKYDPALREAEHNRAVVTAA